MDLTEAAKSMVAHLKEQYSAPSTLVLTDETKFPHLDLGEYRTFRAEMESQGFRYLCDLDLLEVSRSPTTLLAPTMIRSLVSADGYIATDYYQTKPRVGRRLKSLMRGLIGLRLIDAPRDFAQGMRTRLCVGFETEFDDGSFLVTSNAHAASLMSGPPSIESRFYPYGTPTATLLEAHRARLREISQAESRKRPVAVRSVDDLLRMQKRQSAHKVAYRSAAQWVTQSEMHAFTNGDTELGNAMFAEVQKLLADEARSRGHYGARS